MWLDKLENAKKKKATTDKERKESVLERPQSQIGNNMIDMYLHYCMKRYYMLI